MRVSIHQVPLLLGLARSFHEEAKAPGEFNPKYWVAVWTEIINAGNGVIFAEFQSGTPVATIGGLIAASLYSPRLDASEAFWYVKKEVRGGGVGYALYKEFEGWAKSRNASLITMMNLVEMDRFVEQVYRDLGFRPLEVHWYKEI